MGTFLRMVGGVMLVTTFFLPAVSCGVQYSQFQIAAKEPGPWGIVAFLSLVLFGIWTVLGPILHSRPSRVGEGVQIALTVAAAAGVACFIYRAHERDCTFLWPIGVQVGAVFIIFIGSLLRFRSRTRW